MMTDVLPVEAVLLDLDGTLFDHTASARAGVGAWLAGYGVAMAGTITEAWFAAEERHHGDWTRGLISFEEQRRRRLREILPMVGLTAGGDDALDAVFADYQECYRAAWRGFDDALDAVADLHARGLVTAVLTNGTEVQQRAKLQRIGLLDSVGPVFTAEALGVAKPSPRAFAEVCAALDLAPGSVLHVGDDHALDVVAAREAGLRAVHLDRTGTGPRDDERITTLADLGGHLDRLDDAERRRAAGDERDGASASAHLAPGGPGVPGWGG